MLGNRVEGAGLEFWGGSFIADPFGRVIAKASHDKEEILIAEIDLDAAREHAPQLAFLRDRRIDAYAPITKRFLDPGCILGPRRRTEVANSNTPMTRQHPANSATACPPSGSPTKPPGSPGRTIPRTGRASFRPFPGSTPRSSASSPQRESVHILVQDDASPAAARREHPRTRRRQSRPASAFTTGPPTASGPATPAPSSFAIAKAASPSPTGTSTPGPSTPTGSTTTSFPAASPNCSACTAWQPTVMLCRRSPAPPGS